jgi:hypothetical protein
MMEHINRAYHISSFRTDSAVITLNSVLLNFLFMNITNTPFAVPKYQINTKLYHKQGEKSRLTNSAKIPYNVTIVTSAVKGGMDTVSIQRT